MHTVALQLAPILGAEKSKVPFFIAGGALVVWALFLSLALGMRKPDFPGGLSGQRAVSAITAVLVLTAVSTAVITSGPPAKSAQARPAAPSTTSTAAEAPSAPATSPTSTAPTPPAPQAGTAEPGGPAHALHRRGSPERTRDLLDLDRGDLDRGDCPRGRRELHAGAERRRRRPACLQHHAAEHQGGHRHDQDGERVGAGTQRDDRPGNHRARRDADLRGRHPRAHAHAQARQVHLLLLGARPPPGGHGRYADRLVKLYVCWGTFPTPRPGGHPCANAYHALKDAGYEPEVIKSYGFAPLPEALNRTRGRREVQELTGNRWVPTLVLDDGTVIDESRAIVEWAGANPA